MGEMQVLNAITNWDSDLVISRQLGISDRTVANHLARIFRKLCVNSRTQAAVKAITLGLIPVRPPRQGVKGHER
jgi:DNA-binding NarL/FixJ family response regulator